MATRAYDYQAGDPVNVERDLEKEREEFLKNNHQISFQPPAIVKSEISKENSEEIKD